MKRIVNLTVVVVFACLMIAFCAGSVTTFADGHPADKCVECGKAANSHGEAVVVETDGKHQSFCCQGCVNKYEKEHHDESQNKDKEHHSEGHHDKDKGHH